MKLYDIAISRKRQKIHERTYALSDANNDATKAAEDVAIRATYNTIREVLHQHDGRVLIPVATANELQMPPAERITLTDAADTQEYMYLLTPPDTFTGLLQQFNMPEDTVSNLQVAYMGASSATPKMPFLSDKTHISNRYHELRRITDWMQIFTEMKTTTECYVHMLPGQSSFHFKWISSMNSRYYVPDNTLIDPLQNTIVVDTHTYSLRSQYPVLRHAGENMFCVPGCCKARMLLQDTIDVRAHMNRRFHPYFMDTPSTYVDMKYVVPTHAFRYYRQTEVFTDVLDFAIEHCEASGTDQRIFRVSEHLNTYVPAVRTIERRSHHAFTYNPVLTTEDQSEIMADAADVRDMKIRVDLRHKLRKNKYSECISAASRGNVEQYETYLVAFKWDVQQNCYIARRCSLNRRFSTPNVVHACGLPAALSSYTNGRLPKTLQNYLSASSDDITRMHTTRHAPSNTWKIDTYNFVPYSEQRYEASFDTVESAPVINIDTAYTASQGDAYANAARLCLAFSEEEASVPPVATVVEDEYAFDQKALQSLEARRRDLAWALQEKQIRQAYDHLTEQCNVVQNVKTFSINDIKVETDCFWYSSDEWRLGFIPFDPDDRSGGQSAVRYKPHIFDGEKRIARLNNYSGSQFDGHALGLFTDMDRLIYLLEIARSFAQSETQDDIVAIDNLEAPIIELCASAVAYFNKIIEDENDHAISENENAIADWVPEYTDADEDRAESSDADSDGESLDAIVQRIRDNHFWDDAWLVPENADAANDLLGAIRDHEQYMNRYHYGKRAMYLNMQIHSALDKMRSSYADATGWKRDSESVIIYTLCGNEDQRFLVL